jgi:tripartite-type tricarboxylate transporter receptor subunit TctC
MKMKISRRSVMRSACATAVAPAAGILPVTARAADFPDKPVKLIVGFAPGGATDLVSRLLAERLAAFWGKSVVVDNKTGASGTVAAEQVIKSAPDGYTLLLSPQTSIAVAPHMYANPPYDPLKDLTPITVVTSTPLLMVANPAFPASNFSEFLAYARKNPGRIKYASGGNGSSPHMVFELINMQFKLSGVHVPYRGEQPAINDLLGNHVDVLFANLPSALPFVQDGKLKALVSTGEQRSSLAPNVPTIIESTGTRIAAVTWNGLYGPAGLSPALVDQIYAAVSKVLKDEATRKHLEALGNDLVLNDPSQFAQYLKAEYDRWGDVIKTAGIRMD